MNSHRSHPSPTTAPGAPPRAANDRDEICLTEPGPPPHALIRRRAQATSHTHDRRARFTAAVHRLSRAQSPSPQRTGATEALGQAVSGGSSTCRAPPRPTTATSCSAFRHSQGLHEGSTLCLTCGRYARCPCPTSSGGSDERHPSSVTHPGCRSHVCGHRDRARYRPRRRSYSLVILPDQGESAIYNFVNSATKSIDMTIYELRDTTLVNDLVNKEKAGVQVRVILNAQHTSVNGAAYSTLSAGGVGVTYSSSAYVYTHQNSAYVYTHQKTITVDGTKSYISTGNFDTTYYSTSRDYGVFDSDSADVAAIEQVFNADYAKTAITPSVGTDLVWSPTDSQSHLLSLINGAQHSLDVEEEAATDTTGANGSTTFTWNVNPSSGKCTPNQLLGNPGFETGSAAPWSASSGVINSSSSEPPHSGSWDAWLDGYGTTHTDTLSQAVTIPSGCSSYQLSFWLHIDTAETTTTSAYDTLSVQILNSSGTVLGTLATYSNLDHITGYAQHTFDLSAYAGQNVTLRFTGSEDYELQTSFVIDDTAINIS
ncbi:phospholipase D-like domain-containing protein [Streptomyces humicola]|uniref:phospholipase D-like domain-containing protein n=1 Tax=Streptomyces humicola TaxID=2953240 RepID=UPI003FD8CE65